MATKYAKLENMIEEYIDWADEDENHIETMLLREVINKGKNGE